MTTSARFPPEPRSARAARRFVEQSLTDVTPMAIQRVALMVSELATNALRHGHGVFTVTVDRRPGSVRVSVEDGGSGIPLMGDPSPEDASGRGLRIVDVLSQAWGIQDRDGGKVVWFSALLDDDGAAGTTTRSGASAERLRVPTQGAPPDQRRRR